MKLVAVSIGSARPTPGRKTSKTGIFKEPVDHPVLVGAEGLAGDRIVNRKHHGGPEQAVYLECLADLQWWEGELGRPVPPGTFGENLVIDGAGLENGRIAIGDRFQIGDVLLEVTSARVPCANFALRMEDPLFVKRYTRAARPGAYARVLEGGTIRAGDAVTWLPYEGHRVTLPDCLHAVRHPPEGEERARLLSTPLNRKLRDWLSG
jgi:MOSC domain-containing protein YiiM